MQEQNDTQAGQPFESAGGGQPPVPPVAAAAWPVQSFPTDGQPAAQPRKSRKGLFVAVALVLVLVLCCGGWVVGTFTGSGEQPAGQREAAVQPPVSVPAGTPAAPTTEPVEEPVDESESDTMGLPLGTTVTVTNDNGQVDVKVSKSSKFRKARKSACSKYMPGPDQGYYLVLDVTMEVVSGEGSINSLFFEFVDADGVTSSSISGMFSGCGKQLDSGNGFRAGTKRSGQLIFDVASPKGTVEFGIVGPVASWKVG